MPVGFELTENNFRWDPYLMMLNPLIKQVWLLCPKDKELQKWIAAFALSAVFTVACGCVSKLISPLNVASTSPCLALCFVCDCVTWPMRASELHTVVVLNACLSRIPRVCLSNRIPPTINYCIAAVCCQLIVFLVKNITLIWQCLGPKRTALTCIVKLLRITLCVDGFCSWCRWFMGCQLRNEYNSLAFVMINDPGKLKAYVFSLH